MKIKAYDEPINKVTITLNSNEYLVLAEDCLIKNPPEHDFYSYQLAKDELVRYVNSVYNESNSRLIEIFPPDEQEINFFRNARNKQIKKGK